jgi:uncharacterized RmlC-like cupin family protein
MSQTEPTAALLARNNANEPENVTDLPQLDTLPHLQLEGSR